MGASVYRGEVRDALTGFFDNLAGWIVARNGVALAPHCALPFVMKDVGGRVVITARTDLAGIAERIAVAAIDTAIEADVGPLEYSLESHSTMWRGRLSALTEWRLMQDGVAVRHFRTLSMVKIRPGDGFVKLEMLEILPDDQTRITRHLRRHQYLT